ncbi:hypothetical protein HNO88_002988 [Novosphingobium chloroacetimidivorans]|uniref:Uncharacterized protein n=1 Tax=Novosphingobium chloroacetimidivorans TaxID=1428314 RepID=A0A7W7KCB4_9SPHN|nr:hypothetical protein [Novosphingobium chloroacetimidivorans]MBB4859659.1 hypothetical protein [Novosphingobium chloroacetimidivorans]
MGLAFGPLLLSVSAVAQTLSIVTEPPVGAEATVAPGEGVYSFSRLYTIDGARLTADSGPGSYLRGRSVAAGTQLVPVATKSTYKGCVPAQGTFDPAGPCFMDDDGDGKFDRQATNDYNVAQKLIAPVPYEKAAISIAREDAIKRVILYQGASGDSLRFSYREFNFDLARPAFTEEITVPREAFPAMVRIKNVQIEVLGVSGMGLRYRLVKVVV